MKHLVQYEIEMNEKNQFVIEKHIKKIYDDAFLVEDLKKLNFFSDNEIEDLCDGKEIEYKYNDGMSIVYKLHDDAIEEIEIDADMYQQHYETNGDVNFDWNAYD